MCIQDVLKRHECLDEGMLEAAVLGILPGTDVTARRRAVHAVHRRESWAATPHEGTPVREVRESREWVRDSDR